MICTANGLRVAMPSRTAARDPAMLTTRVLPEMPASPRDTPASTMPADSPDARSASEMPRHDEVHPADHGGVQRVADLHLVGGHHHDTVDDETGLTEKLGHQRTAVVLFVAMGSAVIDDDDERAAHQLPWLLHELNRIGGHAQRCSHSQRSRSGPGRHCCIFPSVTCTLCGSPDGSR